MRIKNAKSSSSQFMKFSFFKKKNFEKHPGEQRNNSKEQQGIKNKPHIISQSFDEFIKFPKISNIHKKKINNNKNKAKPKKKKSPKESKPESSSANG